MPATRKRALLAKRVLLPRLGAHATWEATQGLRNRRLRQELTWSLLCNSFPLLDWLSPNGFSACRFGHWSARTSTLPGDFLMLLFSAPLFLIHDTERIGLKSATKQLLECTIIVSEKRSFITCVTLTRFECTWGNSMDRDRERRFAPSLPNSTPTVITSCSWST